mmetsp:Transcript_8999/g.26959  ORF Transcript_8999/g.26959 Transcript_8999/m.26959 type:complete len:878 (+) Transcript_8999:131-2764(+)
MAGAGGIEGLHAIDGICDLCGEQCDSETQELNALTCTFAPNCPEDSSCYHQDCLERYLKNIRCEKNRKTGFKCPRGCGKGTKYDEPCRGKIDKSHPIHVRNDNNKKRKKAKMPEVLPEALPRFGPAAKAARAKEREEEKAKQKKAAAAAAVTTSIAAPSKAKAAAVKKESLASAAAAARRELGLGSGSAAKPAKSAPVARTYEDVIAVRTAARTAPAPVPSPVGRVWGAAKAPAPKPSAVKTPAPVLSSSEAFPAVAVANKPSVPIPKGPWASAATAKSALRSMSSGAATSSSAGKGVSTPKAASPRAPPLNAVAARLASPSAAIAAAPPAREEVQKASKAFKKNMRRAERKREKEADASVTSEPSPPATPHQTAGLGAQQSADSSPARRGCSPSDATLPSSREASQLLPALDLDAGSDLTRCLQAVAVYKLQQAAQQLQQLGWQQWQAALALNLCGALLPAATWLLEDAAASRVSCIADAQKLLSDAVQCGSLPEVNVTHEAEQLEAAATALDVPLPTVCAEVTRCGGDLRAALATLTSLPQPQQRLRVSGGVSGGSVVGSPAAGSSQQRHQRQFSLLGLSACSPGRPSSSALVDPQDPQVSATKAHVSGPIGTWPARSANDGSSSAAASQQGSLMGALPPLPNGRQMAGSGFESSAPSAAGSLSNMHSRVSSFDMLSMGAPWSELLTNSTDSFEEHGHHKSQGDGRNSSGQTFRQQLSQQGNSSSPFGVSPLSHDVTPFGRRSGLAQHHHHSSSLFESPAASFSGPSGVAGGGPGLEHYASALSSQPSWTSTSSNLWGAPLAASSTGGLPGCVSASELHHSRQSSDFQTAGLPESKSTAATGSHAGIRAPAINGNNPAAINDSELNALMATLMCR